MNPWDLSCRPPKVVGEPQNAATEQLHNEPANSSVTLGGPGGGGGTELRLVGGGGGGGVPALGPNYSKPAKTTACLVPMPITNTVHLAAYSPVRAASQSADCASSQSSSTSSSSCTATTASSSLSSFSSSSPSTSPVASIASTNSQYSSSVSSRSNSLETSDELQLAHSRNARAIGSNGVGLTKQAIDQLHNSSNAATNTGADTSSSSRCSTTSSSGDNNNSNSSSLLLLDRKARKKDQNRRAAYNYRRKKMEEKNRMREDEMRLVYSRVCLIGYVEELEGSIMYILNTKTRKILDKDGNSICFLCPICLQSCDNILNLRSHLNEIHYENSEIISNNNKSC